MPFLAVCLAHPEEGAFIAPADRRPERASFGEQQRTHVRPVEIAPHHVWLDPRLMGSLDEGEGSAVGIAGVAIDHQADRFS
jgi:hypothetical protein